MTVSVRPMRRDDKPAIMQILRNTPEFLPFEVPVAEELIDCYLRDPSGSGYYVLVAEVDSAVEGYTCYGPAPLTEGTWDIYWTAVSRDKQRKGIGWALTKEAESLIKQARGRQVFVETSSKPEYEKTRCFHAVHGYETVCHVPDYYAPGDHKLVLRKQL